MMQQTMPSPLNAEDEGDEIKAFMRHFVSDILPYIVVLGSLMLKVPQIFTILKNRSASGISFTAVVLDLTSCVIGASWGIAQALQFKDFGENLFVTVEVAMLLVLVGHFQKNMSLALIALVIQIIALVTMSLGALPRSVHEWLLGVQIILDMCSRLPQIVMNNRNKSTGQLSFITFYFAFIGKVSRLLTTFQNVPVEKGRDIMLAQFGTSVGLNALILTQILVYRKNTEAMLRKEMAERDKSRTSDDFKNKKRQ